MTQLKLLFLGAMLGFTLSHIGFTSWDEVHAMFTFADVRMFLAFAVGVSLLTLAFTVIQKTSSPAWSPRPIHRGTIAGGVRQQREPGFLCPDRQRVQFRLRQVENAGAPGLARIRLRHSTTAHRHVTVDPDLDARDAVPDRIYGGRQGQRVKRRR